MTYTRSTDVHREPRGENVTRSVDVPVVPCPALGANPPARGQLEFLDTAAAARASLRAWKELVDLDVGATVPSALVLEHPKEAAPGGVGDCSRKPAILDHVAHPQALDHDHLVFANQSCAEFMQMILPSVGNTGVVPGEFLPHPVSVLRAFLLAGQRPGKPALPGQFGFGEAWVGDLFARRQGDERGEAYVQTHGGTDGW